MKKLSSIIIGLAGFHLSLEEKALLLERKPSGIILFSRNIESKNQVITLINEVKSILGSDLMFLIDQEGGEVSRLKPPNWPQFCSAKLFGEIAKKDLKIAEKAVFYNYALIGLELKELGFNYNCAPVVDLSIKNTSNIIGSRSFSSSTHIVSKLGYAACIGLASSGITPIIKHIPGHGRARVDSHLELPELNLNNKNFENDIIPFQFLKEMPAAMTAHIKFNDIDSKFSVTHSEKIISKIIRKKIGFNGILFSDDICMKALKGNYFDRSKFAKKAGCDFILHCNGKIQEVRQAIMGAGKVSLNSQEKLNSAKKWTQKHINYDSNKKDLRKKLSNIIRL